ncbi:reverse transcriptase domain-containing protein [Tanacetum coccineum]
MSGTKIITRQEAVDSAARGNRHDERDPRDVREERLRQRFSVLEINPFDRIERQYEDTSTDSTVEEYENEGSEFENIFHQRHPRQRAPLQRHRRPSPAPPKTDMICSLGIRTEIPEFEGRLCPDDFLDWLRTVDRIFDLRDTPDHIKVKLVAIRLKKSASLWWDHVAKSRYRKVHIGLNRGIKQDEAAHGKNLALTQSIFISGVSQPQTTNPLRLALKVEKQLLAKQKTTTRFGSSSRAPQSATGPVRVGPIKAEPPALIGVSPTPTTSSLRCFKCQGIGHLKRDCPNKQVLTLIDEVDPLYDTEDEAETEVVYPDRGELLVTRRLLNTAVLDQDDDTTWLRTNIFHTQCTTKGKVCTVIIDGGSCENMVSTTMVEKLVVSLLNEFKDVFPEEIPAGLPVIRKIQHCIDFLPGASIPNKPAYRMNPKEFAELHRQNTMAEQNVPAQPPTRTDEQIVPRSQWLTIGKSNLLFNAQKIQKNPIFQISVDILRNTNFFQALTASANVPAIYLQQFWKTMSYNEKTGVYSCQLDEQWFDLSADLLRKALAITPVNPTHPFELPPSGDTVIDFVNELGYPEPVEIVSSIRTNYVYQPWRAILSLLNQCLTGKTSGSDKPRHPVLQMLWGIVTQTNVDHAELIWEEFTQGIQTFFSHKASHKASLKNPKKKVTPLLIPYGRFSKVIIYYLASNNNIHRRPDSAVHHTGDDYILGNLKFVPKGESVEVFGMAIPDPLITEAI